MNGVPEKNLAPLETHELQRMWSSLNATYFDSRLPTIEIQWSSRLTSSVGLFVSETGPRTQHVSPDIRHGVGRVIRLSLPLLRAQSLAEIRGTLAHEMIHQWQFDVKKCHPSHGREFRRMMKLMNHDGLGITVYHTLLNEVAALSKYTWQCQKCGRAYHRQRKSLSSKTHRCGSCWGELQEVSSGMSWSRLHGEAKSKPLGDQRMGLQPPVQLVFDFMADSSSF
ncbi:SprT family zinc-dependent metalloprotease [Candidatus Nitronereus thalassa]|uniref:SprT family zinc-dependent metalloprotease n=1 Tax=Candidatus Nitronereus thalassa TaxID=3020898 RepID=A0ABU3K6I0_9BACT|nr:SprT family zinc-dependent metalloprotease [Candidatus Nitronereus thalassa]MDT7042040.1 SprT family zinc-dependent metalloprotease [Candidatus Nitronereus thalassa]